MGVLDWAHNLLCCDEKKEEGKQTEVSGRICCKKGILFFGRAHSITLWYLCNTSHLTDCLSVTRLCDLLPIALPV